MTEQEWITDLICSEKKMTANYDAFASGCVNTALREAFLNLLQQSHKVQAELFQLGRSRGWYPVESAPDSRVRLAYQEYTRKQP